MKKRYIFAALSLSALTVAGIFLYPEAGNEGKLYGEAEEFLAAEQWRLMRLRDPATGKIPENIRLRELSFASGLPSRELDIRKKNSSAMLSSGAEWKPRGPWDVGGRTRALAIDAANENIILAGGVSGGMWRSTDAGKSWTKTTTPDQFHSVSCIAQDKRPGKTNTWYYGTGEIRGGTVGSNPVFLNGNGIFKSTDNGLSWAPLPATQNETPQSFDSPFEYISSIVVDPSNSSEDEIYASTTIGGIYRSSDGGATWKAVLGGFGNNYSYTTDVTITQTGVVYAALSQNSASGGNSTVKGLYRSADGLTWKDITPPNWPSVVRRIVLATAPSDESIVYFLAETPGSGFEGKYDVTTAILSEYHSFFRYKYVSGDGTGAGGQWENRSQNLPAFGMPSGDFFSQGGYDLVINVKPDNPNVVIIGGTNLYRSSDGFASTANSAWIGGTTTPLPPEKFRSYPNHHSDQHAIVFLPSNPNVMYTGNDGGVQRTDNVMAPTVEWKMLNDGYITTQFYHVAIDHATPGDYSILGGTQDNGSWFTRSTDYRQPWKKPLGADGAFNAIADGGTAHYSSKQEGRVHKSILNANGDTISQTRVDPAGPTKDDYLFINPFLIDPNNNNIMYIAGGSKIWRNNDLSGIPMGRRDSATINWDSLTNTKIPTGQISALGISKTPANMLYYGTSAGLVYRVDNANAGNPNPVNITGKFPAGYVSCIAVDPEDGNKVFVVFSNYNILSIFYSEDAGKTWTPVSGNLEQFTNGTGTGPSVTSLTMLKVQGKMMYFVGTSTGLYSTTFIDGMSTIWVQEAASSIGNVIVEWLDSRSSDGYIVAATYGNGVYSANVTSFPDKALPGNVELVSPEQGSAGIDASEKFIWHKSAGAMRYRLQVASDSLFANIIYDQSGISDTTQQVTNLGLGVRRYYWRVRATNEGGASGFSPARSFRTIVGTPNILAPSGTVSTLSPTIVWNKAEGAEYYHLQLSDTTTFSRILHDRNNLTDTALTIPDLNADKRYYVRVAAFGDGLLGNYDRKVFIIKSSSAGGDASGTGLLLGQNYPNPCANSTTVQFTLPHTMSASLKVYDATGRLLMTVFEREFGEGQQSWQIDTRALPRGSYLYTLQAGGRTLSRVMQKAE